MKILTIFGLLFLVGTVLGGEYFYSNGTKYYISAPMKKNWFQAHRYCHAHSMHLATEHSEEEHKILIDVITSVIYSQSMLLTPEDHFWTSGTDIGQSDLEFYWFESGHAALFTNWIDGQPVAKRDGCIILHGGTYKYKWYDKPCTSSYYFICQDRLFIPDSSQRMFGNSSLICG